MMYADVVMEKAEGIDPMKAKESVRNSMKCSMNLNSRKDINQILKSLQMSLKFLRRI